MRPWEGGRTGNNGDVAVLVLLMLFWNPEFTRPMHRRITGEGHPGAGKAREFERKKSAKVEQG